MQWLIDIIVNLVRADLGYFDRGDVPNPDYGIGDFTTDDAWHELDLSAIVPSNAVCVLCNLRLRSLFITRVVRFRTPGMAGDKNAWWGQCSVVGTNTRQAPLIVPDANRIIEYRIPLGSFNVIDFTIRGWWLK